MRKNILKSILFLVLSFLLSLTFVGCDCNGCSCKSCNEEAPEGTSSINLYFSSDDINLIVNEARRLDVFVDGEMQNPADIIFASENPNVVVINELGEAIGYATGSTYVTATMQGSTTKCFVNVGLSGLAPEIVFDTADYTKYEQIAIPLGDELELSAKISFNGQIFDDAVFSYEISEDGLGEIGGTKFISNQSTGELDIFVRATWRGIQVEEKVVKVVLTNSLNMTVNGEPFSTIKTTAVVPNKSGALVPNTFDFNVVITDRVSNQPLPINIVLENEYKKFVSLDKLNNIVTAKAMGTAVIEVFMRNEDGTNGAFLRNIKIVVSPYIFENEKAHEIYLFDAADGLFDVDAIFGQDVKVAGAEFLDRDIEISADSEGRVLGITSESAVEPTAEYVNVYTSVYGYRVQVKAYGKIVDSPEDLLWFNFSTDGKDYDAETMNVKTIEGYFIMTKDIDMSDVDYSVLPKMNQSGTKNESKSGKFATVGFKGTFDGQGHSIYNMKGMVGGIFGVLNGTVKNVAFKNASFDAVTNDKGTEITVSILASRIFNASLIENVYINVASVESTNYGVLSSVVSSDIVAKNLVVVLNTDKITSHCSPLSARAVRASTGNGFSHGSHNPYNKMQNVILVTGIPLGTYVNNTRGGADGIYRMEAANVTNLDVTLPFDFLTDKVVNYTTISNSTIVRFNNVEELKANKDAISGILEKFGENENWLITESGEIFWGNGESLFVNGNEGVTEIDLFLENEFGFSTQADVGFIKDGVDFTNQISITPSINGIVSIEGNVIKAVGAGDVEIVISAGGSELSLVIHVKEALASAKLFADINGEKASVEYAGETINLYYKEGEDISATHNTYVDVVLSIEGKPVTKGYTVSVKEGLGTIVEGNRITANGEGDSVILIDCGSGVSFEIVIKTHLVFDSDDLTGSEDFPADWLSGLGK